MVIYFAAPWLSKKYLSTSISANNCLLSRWWLHLAVYEDKPFYSWARNSHSERKKILIQNWISFPQIFLSSQTWRMYKKRTWWHRLQPHPGGMLLYPRGTGGGGNRQILLWSHTWSMYKKRTWWHILRPHPGGMLLYPWGGGGLQEFPKSGPILAFFVLIKGHTTIFFLFFWGGGRDGGQLHLGIPSSKLDPCPWPLLTLLLSGMIKE